MDTLAEFIITNKTLLCVSCLFMLLDIITGLIKAVKTQSYSSTVMRDGLYHKLGFIFAMFISAILELAINMPDFEVDIMFPLFNVVCGYVILVEFSSIIENICVLNPQINNIFGKYLTKDGNNNE